MALDAATIALLGKELEQELVEAKIDKIFQPTRDEVVLNLRKRTGALRLLLSARSGSARVCITQESFENPQTPPSFCMLLRKHFSGGKLLEVQAVPSDRIVLFAFQCVNEMGDLVRNTIAVELMGRYSNLVLLQRRENGTDKILDALKRVDFEDSAVRQLMPGLTYTLPPQQDKLPLLHAPIPEILQAASQKALPVADALMKVCSGIGPVVCREIAYRAFAGADVQIDNLSGQQASCLTQAMEAVRSAYTQSPHPTVVLDAQGHPVEFSFLPLTQYVQGENGMSLVEYDSFSALLEGYYATKDKAERLRQKSRDLVKSVQNLYDRSVRKQSARREELAESEASEHLRLHGELLSANLWAMERGQSQVTVNNYYDNTDITIAIDVRLSPSANAQKYFKEYKKKQTAAKMLVHLLEEGQREIAYLETVLYEVRTAQGEQALGEIRAELKGQGYLKYYKVKDKKQKPSDFLRFRSVDDCSILVGRNNLQNDKLTLKMARGKDLWFHVKNAPGSHVVVFSEGQDIPPATQQQAAMLAVVHSSQNGGAKVAVDCTPVKNVWKANGAKPGMVLYDHYNTVFITVDEAALPAPE